MLGHRQRCPSRLHCLANIGPLSKLANVWRLSTPSSGDNRPGCLSRVALLGRDDGPLDEDGVDVRRGRLARDLEGRRVARLHEAEDGQGPKVRIVRTFHL